MNPIRIIGDKKINKSFRNFRTIKIEPFKNDEYGLNYDSYDIVEQLFI